MFGGILENTDVFVSQEDLALSLWTSGLCIWVGISELVTGFDIDVSPLGDGTEVCIPAGTEREYCVP